jgi:hypothetical protein
VIKARAQDCTHSVRRGFLTARASHPQFRGRWTVLAGRHPLRRRASRAIPGDAVSTKSSQDKRPKRSLGETLVEEASAISARRRSRLSAERRHPLSTTGSPVAGAAADDVWIMTEPSPIRVLQPAIEAVH